MLDTELEKNNLHTTSASDRSQLLCLFAQVFSHPTEDLYQLLMNGEFQRDFSILTERLCGEAMAVSRPGISFVDFEAQYIDLFQIGERGRPAVFLNAGDYESLVEGQPRTEHLLGYSQWYKHFGLQTWQGDGGNDLPDHLVCQLDLLAWLAYRQSELEMMSERDDNGQGMLDGYQRAQRDFIRRKLLPMLALFCPQLSRATEKRGAIPLFNELAMALKSSAGKILPQLETELGASVAAEKSAVQHIEVHQLDSDHETISQESVNLWS